MLCILGHQYRECLKYRGQPKEKLPYGIWLKAKTAAERAKLNRDKERWNNEHHKPNSSPATSRQQWHLNPVLGSSSGATHVGKSKNAEQIRVNHVAGVVKEQSMQSIEGSTQQLIDCKMQASITDTIDSIGAVCKKEENNGGKEIVIESGRESYKKVIHKKNMQLREQNDKGEVISGLKNANLKLKGKKWKLQARNLTSKGESTIGPLLTKRLRIENTEPSPEKKR